MTEEEIRNNIIKTMIIETDDDDENSIVEHIEEFEEKIDYLDLDEKKKQKIRNLCNEIKAEDSLKTKELLFELLQKEIEQ